MELGLVTKDQLTEAMHSDVGKKSGTLEALLEMDGVDSDAVLSALARNYKVPYLDIRTFKPSREAIKLCEEQLCLDFAFVPLDVMGKYLVIATDNPVDFNMLDNLRYKLGMRIKPVFARPDLVINKIQEIYHQHPEGSSAEDSSENENEATEASAKRALDESGSHASNPRPASSEKHSEDKLQPGVEDPSIVRLVNGIIIQAIKVGSSDVQIEPGEQKSIVSLSVEGELRPSLKFPASVHQTVAARIKMMARLDIARSDTPQKGRTRIKLWGKRHELIISSTPNASGEMIAILIQDTADTPAIKDETQPSPMARPDEHAPEKREDEQSPASEQTSARTESRDKPLILVVDDSTSVRNMVQFVLESEGYDIIQAADGQEAWDMVQDIHPSLIVADCDMPKMTGPELVQRLREQSRFNETPIVLLTSKRDEEDEVLGLEVGADDYIGKPVEPLKLQARIKKTLAMYARVRQAMQGD